MILKPRLFRKPRIGHWASKGLVGLWLFNEGSGNTVADLSGNGNVLTAINGNSWSGGDISLAEQELLVKGGDYGAFSFVGGDFTVVWSCKVKNITVDTSAVASQWGNSVNFREWRINYTQNTGVLDFRVNDGTNRAETATTALTVNVQDNRAIVFRKGLSLEFYKDGILDNSPAFAWTPTLVTPRRAFIGAIGGDNAAEGVAVAEFRGTFRYFFIYNRALSASKIALLYREPFAMFERDPIELWVGATSVGAPPPVGMAGAMTTNTGYWGW